MKSGVLNKLFLIIAAFTLTSNVLTTHFEAVGNESVAALFGFPLLAVVTFFSVVTIMGEVRLWIPSVLTALFLVFLVWFQGRHDSFGTSGEFAMPFLIHGVGGFLMGMAISDCKSFIKYLGVFSFAYLIILLPEPITHGFLKGESMTTGYVLTSLIILLILSYYTTNRDNKLYFCLALIMSALTVVFTSRGCGLSIALAWIFFYLRERAQKGKKIGKSIFVISVIAFIIALVFPFIASMVMSSSLNISDGALVYKYIGGDAGDSNGRNDIWALGIAAIAQNWRTGMGFGADRIISNDSFIHDIFLELFIDFGIPLAFLVLYLYWKPVIKIFKNDSSSITTALAVALLIRSWGQLLFSSSYLMNMLNLMFIYGICLRIVVNQHYLTEVHFKP